MRWLTTTLLSLVTLASCTNFPWEEIQLTEDEVYPDIAFGKTHGARYTGPKCRVAPGDPTWPSEASWDKFNKTLGGVLLKPVPPGAVCYPGEHYDADKCKFLLTQAGGTRFYSDHPLTVLTDWATGNTCQVSASPVGNCTQGGLPVYVVNATTVRHIQLAVNFARNRHLRVVIRNAGHDFNGRSTGYGALSIYTHHLKDFEYIPEYTIGQYKGRVARVSAGIETWELTNYMNKYNMTVEVPGGETVGAFGGWIAGGGHNLLSSLYGHGADQVLAFQVVTADGRYHSVTPEKNADLFYAMLGGGGGTYGVLTSAIIKVHPPTPVTTLHLEFRVGSPELPFNTNSSTAFWDGVWLYQLLSPSICDAGATHYSYISRQSPTSYSLTVDFQLPLLTPSQITTLFTPLYTGLAALGIPVNLTIPPAVSPNPARPVKTGTGAAPSNLYFASRLFPRANWSNRTLYNATFAAIRATVEQGGFVFHGVNFWTPAVVAGWPGSKNSLAGREDWRGAIMHADIMDREFGALVGAMGSEGVEGRFWKRHGELKVVMDGLREVTKDGGGSYFNEADVLEPGWQGTFFGGGGDTYERLVRVKKERDPWGLFWAVTTPGSERWRVEEGRGLPTQNGRLCLTGKGHDEEQN